MDPQKGRRSFFVFGSNNEPVRERGLIKVSEEDAVRSSRAREENAQRQRRILERAGPADTKQTNTSAGDEKIRFEAPLYKPSTASPTPPGPGGASYFPWSVVPVDGGGAQIVQATLVSDLVLGTELSVSGLTGLVMASDTEYWLKGTFDASGVPTGWEATTDTPTSARIVWTGTAPTFIQSEAWLPIARVILGSHPYLPGYDFQVGEDVYHLEQLCTTRLILARGPVNGRVVYYPIPL
jgi:hypothetical protein